MALPATDNFTRANGGLGANWTTVTGASAPQIVGNLVEPAAVGGTNSEARWNADALGNDQYAEIVIVALNTASGRQAAAMVRCASAARTFYSAQASGPLGATTTITLEKRVAGTKTVLGSVVTTVAANDVLRISAVGTVLTATLNGATVIQLIDSTIAAGSPGLVIATDVGAITDAKLDSWRADVLPGSTHTVSGTGSFAMATPTWLSVSITGRPARLTSGAANPANWYHVGMVSWGTANGAITAHPITRDLELLQLPPGQNTLWYAFVSGVTAVITELTGP